MLLYLLCGNCGNTTPHVLVPESVLDHLFYYIHYISYDNCCSCRARDHAVTFVRAPHLWTIIIFIIFIMCLAVLSGGAFCLRASPPNGLLIIYYSGSAKHPQEISPARFARRGRPYLFLIIFIIGYAAILIQSPVQTTNPTPGCLIFDYIYLFYYRHHCIPMLLLTPPDKSRETQFISIIFIYLS